MAIFTVLGNLTDIIINVDINVCVDVDDGVGLVVDGDVDVAVDVGGDFTISFVRPALDGRRQKQPLTAGTYSTASQPGFTFEEFSNNLQKKSFFLYDDLQEYIRTNNLQKSDALYCVGAVGDIFHCMEDLKTITYLLTTQVQMGQPTGLDWSD